MTDTFEVAMLFNAIFRDSDKYREALREVKYVEYWELTGMIYGVFESDKDRYETFVDIFNRKWHCTCKNNIYRNKMCKHAKFLFFLAYTHMKVPLSYLKLGDFRLIWHKDDCIYEYWITKGKVYSRRIT